MGVMKLDHNHEYYYQVQTQLGVCELEEAFFVVWNKHSLHVELIKFDRDHWTCMISKAERFFNVAILPELVGRFYSLRKHKHNALPCAHTELKICYCYSEVGEFNIICCNQSGCKIKYFHQPCMFFRSEPKNKKSWLCPDCKDSQLSEENLTQIKVNSK